MPSNSTGIKVVYKSLAFMGYPQYRVGDDGSVWSCCNARWGLRNSWKKRRPGIGSNGRMHVSLGRGKQIRVHRLVLLAFVGPCPEGMEACHNDGNASNNRIGNLRWDVHSNNMQDMVRHGTCYLAKRDARGERNATAKLTEEKVRKIRKMYASGKYTLKGLAAIFRVHFTAIHLVIARKNWAHVE